MVGTQTGSGGFWKRRLDSGKTLEFPLLGLAVRVIYLFYTGSDFSPPGDI